MLTLIASLVLGPQTWLPRAHSHNDYEQSRPLSLALESGLGSIEADIFLIDGELRVAHDRKDTQPGRTLQTLYLDPLQARAKANRGWIYGRGQSLTLLVDIKEDGEAVYRQLRKDLLPYRSLLTEFNNGKVKERAVTVILSGDRPIETLKGEAQRYAFIDGRLDDLGKGIPASLIPLISDSYVDKFFRLKSLDEIRPKVRAFAEACHKEGKRLRFWATPDTDKVREMLWDESVDLLGTDHPAEMSAWMRARPKG
ncbi:MAG: phosphatidylinositol-specific phospholipase C/glycerophosphodiester phosphodiesterase family protein [Fimbriimonas sp.]